MAVSSRLRARFLIVVPVIALVAAGLGAGDAVAGSQQQDQVLACGTANAALNRPATASSVENGGVPASAAVDGNGGTRWGSAFADPQWLQIDLGSTVSV